MKKLILFASSIIILSSCGGGTSVLNIPAAPLIETEAKVMDVETDLKREILTERDDREKPNPIKLISFVSADDLSDLNAGMTYQEVTKRMGRPYDILFNQADGYKAVVYHYKKVHVILNDQNENSLGATGKREFGNKIETAYLMFNKSDKLELVISEKGLEGKYSGSGKTEGLLDIHKLLYKPTVNERKLLIKLD